MDLSFESGDNKIYSSKEAIENRNCLLGRGTRRRTLSQTMVFSFTLTDRKVSPETWKNRDNCAIQIPLSEFVSDETGK